MIKLKVFRLLPQIGRRWSATIAKLFRRTPILVIIFSKQWMAITFKTVTTLAITGQSRSLILFKALWCDLYFWSPCITNKACFKATKRSNIMYVEFQRVVTSCLWKQTNFIQNILYYFSNNTVASGSSWFCTSRRSLQKLMDMFACAQTLLQ